MFAPFCAAIFLTPEIAGRSLGAQHGGAEGYRGPSRIESLTLALESM